MFAGLLLTRHITACDHQGQRRQNYWGKKGDPFQPVQGGLEQDLPDLERFAVAWNRNNAFIRLEPLKHFSHM